MLWIDVALGAVLGGAFAVLARRAGRAERLWLAAGLAVAALIYPLAGLPAHGPGGLAVEWVGVAIFGALAVLGAWLSPWILALGWALHAPWDLLLPWLADTSYVPHWYGAACLGFDLAVAAAVAARAVRGTPRAADAVAR
jgi:hypothetical protein